MEVCQRWSQWRLGIRDLRTNEQIESCGSLVETTQNRVVSLSRWIMCGMHREPIVRVVAVVLQPSSNEY